MASYLTSTREELSEYWADIASLLSPNFLFKKEAPFVISIDGSFQSGKTIPWDEIPPILNKAFIKVAELSDDDPYIKTFETTDGIHKSENRIMRMIAFNADFIDKSYENDDRVKEILMLANLFEASPKEYKDYFSSEQNKKPADLVVITNKGVLSTDNADIVITTLPQNTMQPGPKNQWKMATSTKINNPELFAANATQELIDKYKIQGP